MNKDQPFFRLSPTDDTGQAAKGNEPPLYAQAGVAMTCRSYAEYAAMFDFMEDSPLLKGPVLDVAGGASSFTAELCAMGIEAVAADPRYALSPEEMYLQAAEEIKISTEKLRAGTGHFDWAYYGSLQHHEQLRRQSLERFHRHYSSSAREQAYIPASLPVLPMADDRFAIVVCSHFLFLYGEQVNIDFHEQALRELIRVCRPGGEVRVYPLVRLPYFHPYAALDELLGRLSNTGVDISLEPSRLPFIPGSGTQLVIRKLT